MNNAIKFTPEGGAIIFYSSNDDDEIAIQVSYSGIGIDPRIVPKIFVSFEQGDKDVVKQFRRFELGPGDLGDDYRRAWWIAVYSGGKRPSAPRG